MTHVTRRAILKNGMLAIGSSMIAPGIFSAFANAPAQAATLAQLGQPRAMQANTAGRTLVVVQMAGGNDGLHAVIPYTDPLYAQNRTSLQVAPTDQIQITPTLALHGKLASLEPLWNAGKMAIIENVGYPNPNLSHFQSMYIWQTLDMTGAQGTAKTGWLGNYLQKSGVSQGDAFAGLESGNQLATAFMASGIAVPTIGDPTSYGLAGKNTALQTALLQAYQTYPQAQGASAQFGDYLSTIAQTSVDGAAQLKKATAAYKPAATYPKTPLASSLQLVATAITQGLDVRVGYVTIGGFDTHANEAATLDKLYTDLGQAIAAFWADLEAQGADGNVLMMTWSEFGRRVKENGSGGTDHGTSAPLFVFGPGVNGGVHGDAPDLSNLDKSGNLVFQTDFRSVYATVLQQWQGTDPTAILGGSFPTLDFVK